MVDLQELVNRRWNPNPRGVQVYSPLRPVARPSGRTANAGTAQRVLGNTPRQQQRTAQTPRLRVPGVAGSLPGFEYPTGSQQPLPVPGVGGGIGSRLDQLLGEAPVNPPEEESGGGFLGTVVNSLPGKAIMGALNVLDYPRRAIVSSVNEIADAFNGGDASFGDWVDQVQDPTFGFGDVVGSTGNIWADRIIGFGGDVLLDPLTYALGSSAITGTGRAARVGGAVRAVAGGVDEDVAARLSRYGYGALDRSERQLLREAAGDTILDPGYYFKLPFVKMPTESGRLRIPGTGGLERATSSMFGRVRANMAESSLGQAMMRMRSPEGLETAYRKVITGQGDMPFKYATELINFRNAADRAGPAAVSRLNAMSQKLIDEYGVDGLNDAVRQAENNGTGPFAQFMNDALALMEEYGMTLPRGPRQNYAPHIFTDAGGEWIRSGKTDPIAQAFKNVFYKDVNLDETPPHLLQRQLVPRFDETGAVIPYDINGRNFELRTGTIDEINAEFARLVPEAKFKLLDDNATTLIARYSKSLEEGIGVIAGIKALLNSKSGLVTNADDESVLKLVTDWAKTKLLREDHVERLNTQLRAANDVVLRTRAETMQRINSIQGVLGQRMRSTIDKLQEVLPEEKKRLQALLQEEQALARLRGGRSMNGAFGRSSIEGSPGQPIKGKLEREFDRQIEKLTKRITATEEKLAALRDRAAEQMPAWQEAKRQAMERGEIARIPRHLSALREWNDTIEMARRLQMDRESIEVLRARVIANDARQDILQARIGDDSFLFGAANRNRQRPKRLTSTQDPYYEPIASTAEQRFIMPGNTDPGEVDRTITIAQAKAMFDELTPEEQRLINERVADEVARGENEMRAFKEEVAVHDALVRRAQPRTPDTLWRLKSEGMEAVPQGYTDRVLSTRTSAEDQRLAALGALGDGAGAAEMSVQIRDQIAKVGQHEDEVLRTFQRDEARINAARDWLQEMRNEEAHLESMTRLSEGDPSLADLHERMQAQLEHFRSPTGDLGLANARYQDAGMALEQAKKRLGHEEKILREMRDQQFEIAVAENFGATFGPDLPRMPLSPDEEVAVRRNYVKARDRRDAWASTPDGQRSATIRSELDEIERQLDSTQAGSVEQQIVNETGRKGSLFEIDRRGNIRPKDMRNEKVLRHVQERDALVEQLDAAERAGDEALAADLRRKINRKNSSMAKLNFDYDKHRAWTARRNEMSAELNRLDEAAEEATARFNTNAILPPAQRRRLEQEMIAARARRDRAARTLESHSRGADASVSYLERKTRLSELLDQRAELTTRGRALEKQWRTVRKRYTTLDDQVTHWQEKLDAQTMARQSALLDRRQGIPHPQAVKMRLEAIDRTAEEKVERIRNQMRSEWHKMEWELVPKAAEPPQQPFSVIERLRLRKAYQEISNLQAGINADGSKLSIDQARAALRQIEDTLYPISPQAAAEAKGSLGEIEQMLAQVDAARQPWPYPPIGSAVHKILMGNIDPRELRGGAMDLLSRAKSARNVIDNIVTRHQEYLINSGAFVPGDFRFAQDLSAELGRQLDFYAKAPSPNGRSQIAQLTRDLGVLGDFMWTYKRVLDTGETTADDRLASFVLSRELYKESRVLDHRVKTYRSLIESDTERWAAIAHEREILVHQANLDHEEYLMDELRQTKVREARDFTAAEQKEFSRAYKRSKREAAAIERLQTEGAPRLGLLDEDLDQIYSIVERAITDIDDATTGFNDARRVVKDLDQPFRKREELEAYIPLTHGKLTQIRMSHEELSDLVEEAVARGEPTVSWLPWEMNVAPIDWSIEEAEANIRQAPKWQQPELQRKLKAAKDRRAKAQQMSSKIERAESRIEMATPGRAPEPRVMTIDEAKAHLASQESAIAGISNSLKFWQMQLSVLDGTAGERLRVLQRKLRDEVQPPDPDRLARTNAELRNRAKLRPQERGPDGRFASRMTPGEKAHYDLNVERLANVRKGGMDPDDYANTLDEYELLTEVMQQYRALHGDQEEYIANVIDGGNKWFRDLVDGVREPTTDDLIMLKEILGGEQGAYADTFIRTLNNAIAGRDRQRSRDALSLVDLEAMFREIAYTLGDTTIGERMAQRVSGIVSETGVVDEQAIQAMRDELYYSLVRTAQRERTERIRDLSQTLKDLGFEFFIEDRNAIPMPGVPLGKRRAQFTLNEKMYTLGYQQSKQKFSPAKLRAFILERFEDMGYDIKRSLEEQLNDLLMYSQRLDTMRAGLGGQVNMTHMNDPESFFRIMRRAGELNAAEDAGNIASDADAFRKLLTPMSMEEAFEARMSLLQFDLRDAIERNDADAINAAMQAIEDFQAANPLPREGGAFVEPPPALPPPAPESITPPSESPPPPTPPVAVAPPPTAALDPEIEATKMRLITERDRAKAEAAKLRTQIRSLEMEGNTGEAVVSVDPAADLERMAQTSSPPEGSYTQAQIEDIKAKMKRLLYLDERTPEQNAAMTQARILVTQRQSMRWTGEPAEDVARAKALAAQIDAQLEGEAAEAGVIDNAAEISDLSLRASQYERVAEDAQSQLDSMPTAPATTEPAPQDPNLATAVPPSVESPPPHPEPSMVDDTDAALADEGYPAPEAAPGELPARTMDPSITDAELSYDDIRYEHRMAVREFENLSKEYGGFENAPPAVQDQMGQLSARARKLSEMQDRISERAMRDDVDWDRYNRLRQSQPRQRVFDWRTLLRKGTASVATTRTMMQGDMATAVQRLSGARQTLSGPALTAEAIEAARRAGRTVEGGGGGMFRGSLPSQEAKLRAQLAPMEALREQLSASAQEAAAASAADRALIGSLEEKIAAGEAQITATRERLTAEAAAPSPEYAAAAQAEAQGQAQLADQSTQLNNQLARLQMEKRVAEQEFTNQLIQTDMQLGKVRQAVTDTQRGVKSMERSRAEFAKALETAPTPENARSLIADLREVNEWRRGTSAGAPQRIRRAGPTLEGPAGYIEEVDDIALVETMLQEATKAAMQMDIAGINDGLISTRLKQFADGSHKVAPVMRHVLMDGWKPIAETQLRGPDRVVIATGLANSIERVVRAAEQPQTWKLIDKFTSFFKTYATARPGFHVRNAISGVFMNLVDNVRLRELGAAPVTWRAFMDDPAGFWNTAKTTVLNQRTGATLADALNVVFGSGAGGQFMEYGIGTASGMSNVVFQKVMNNALTRFNRRAGAYVEGSIRLAMATDSLRKGMTPAAALDRVVKFHFNYNQVSRFDRTAKRYIPFWTFMSRNLPLQIEQMWLRPQMYLKYQSLVRNFAEDADPYTPQYWLAQGAFTLDPNAAEKESPWYLAPDLPHLRVAEPFEALAQGNIGKAILSDVNPLFMAPTEAYGFGKKLYTGAPIEAEYSEPSDPMKMLLPLFALLGQTERGGESGQWLVDERAQHVARSLLPPLDIAERLTDTGGVRAGRQDETILRSLGAPVYQLTPELRRSTRTSQYYENLERRQTQAELARA